MRYYSSSEIRLMNLRAIIQQHGISTVCRLVGLSPAQLSQYAGPNPNKNLGDSVARRIELAFGLEPNILDNFHAENADALLQKELAAIEAKLETSHIDRIGELIDEIRAEWELARSLAQREGGGDNTDPNNKKSDNAQTNLNQEDSRVRRAAISPPRRRRERAR